MASWTVGELPSRTLAPAGTARVPSTTRSGWVGRRDPSGWRAVSDGSSARMVPVPTTIASHDARSSCTSARDASPVIHRLVPSAAADRPSRVVATFQVTRGRPLTKADVQARLRDSASTARRPPTTSTPTARSRSAPPPARGLGSAWAKTTRVMPAARRAAVQGPVSPVCERGSSVTYAVAPAAASPASASATTSACGVPAPAWKPAPTVSPEASTMTAPTRGFTSARGPPAASSRAADMGAISRWSSAKRRPMILIPRARACGELRDDARRRGR